MRGKSYAETTTRGEVAMATTNHKTYRARADLVRAAFGPGTRIETSTTGCPCCAQWVQIRKGDACLGAGRTFDDAFDQAAGRAYRIGLAGGAR